MLSYIGVARAYLSKLPGLAAEPAARDALACGCWPPTALSPPRASAFLFTPYDI